MSILRNFISENKLEAKKSRRKELTLAMALGTTIGVLTGIAVNSKSDKISKTFKKLKNKNSKYIRDGKDKIEDLLNEKKDDLKNVKSNLEDNLEAIKDKEENVREILDKKLDKSKKEIEDIYKETAKEIKKEINKN